MGKRTKIIRVTNESKALKRLREMSGISVRKLADRLNVSHTLVSHYELGRANVSDVYVERFLAAMELSKEDWSLAIGKGRKGQTHLRDKVTQECFKKLKGLSEDKLVLLNSILSGIQNSKEMNSPT